MNIFNLISANLAGGPQSKRFPERVVPEAEYRGPVHIDPTKCLACGICDYVCVSRAISVVPGEDHAVWTYDPGRCTYCGRCVDHCTGHALTQESDRGANYERPGSMREVVEVTYPTCPECGKPAMPYNEVLLGTAFVEVSDDLRERIHLCERCRLKATQSALKKSFGAMTDTERSSDGR